MISHATGDAGHDLEVTESSLASQELYASRQAHASRHYLHNHVAVCANAAISV